MYLLYLPYSPDRGHTLPSPPATFPVYESKMAAVVENVVKL